MTPTDQALCRGIAELEKKDGESIRQLSNGRLMVEGDGYNYCVPAYLTDPAETVRMHKELLEIGFDISFESTLGLFVVWKIVNIFDKFRYRSESLEHAVAQAYLAMLLSGSHISKNDT